MKRYPCKSARRQNKNGGHDIFIKLQHHDNHVLYTDVGMPAEVLQIIQEEAEWSTPFTV